MITFCVKNTVGGITTLQNCEAANILIVQNYIDIMTPENDETIVLSETGEGIFVNSKTKNVLFSNSFQTSPVIQLTLDDSSSTNVYRINVTTSGFTIKFLTNYSGLVSWRASKL